MKLTADREQLADKLKKCVKFIPSKTLVNAQEYFRCTVKDNIMEIMGADSQCEVKMYCPVKSDVDWAFCIQAAIFLKTISLFRENEVRITKKSDTQIELKNGKASTYKITVDCMPEDFPVMPPPQTIHELSISQYHLRMGLKFTEKFIDDDKSAKVGATGINIHEVDKRLVFTGLDGHMLCRINVPPLAIGSWEKNIVLPPETASKVLSLLNDKGEITMCHNDDKVVFFTDDTIERFEITSTLVNTKYPNSEGLFKKKGADYAVINTLELKDVFMRLKLYSDDVTSIIKMTTNPQNVNELTIITSNTLKPKDGEEIITIKNASGKHINKGFNAFSMLKVLANIESNELFFYFNESNNVASFIEPLVGENEENNFNFLISSSQTN
jgi:DNA polymerase III sliding clamp (beta) subunit (PCNA family)